MNLYPTLEGFYWRIQARIAPALLNSQYHYFEMLKASLDGSTRWLDLGCGHHIVPPWMKVDEPGLVNGLELGVGVDLDEASLKLHRGFQNRTICDLRFIPFSEGAFNLVSANMVAEHLEKPEEVLREVWRVLEPGGVFIIHTPNRRNYQSVIASFLPQGLKDRLMAILHGVKSGDVFETFYRVNTEEEITLVAEKIGFDVVKVEMVNTTPKAKILGPLVIPELLWARFLERPGMRKHRADIIAVLKRKP